MKSQHSAYIVKVTPGQFLEMSDHFKSVRALCPGIVTESTVVMTIPSFTPRIKRNESHYATRSPATFDPMSGLKVILELGKFPWSFFGGGGGGGGIKLQVKG